MTARRRSHPFGKLTTLVLALVLASGCIAETGEPDEQEELVEDIGHAEIGEVRYEVQAGDGGNGYSRGPEEHQTARNTADPEGAKTDPDPEPWRLEAHWTGPIGQDGRPDDPKSDGNSSGNMGGGYDP